MSRRDVLKKEALENSTWNIFSALIQRVGGLFFTIIIARILLPEGFGYYSLVMSVILIASIFTDRGINESLIRYLSGKTQSEKESAKILRYLLNLKLAVISVLTLVLFLVSWPLANYLFQKQDIFLPLILGAIYLFLISLEGFFNSLFFVSRKVHLLTAKETIYQISRVFLVLLFFILLADSINVLYIFICLILAVAFTLSFVLYKCLRIMPRMFNKYEILNKDNKVKFRNTAFYFTITSMSFVALGNIDTIMLGVMLPNINYLGFYVAAFTIASSFAGLIGLGQALLPVFVKVEKNDMEKVFNKVVKYVLIISVPATVGLISVGNLLLETIYGNEYSLGVYPLYSLAFLIILGAQVNLFVYLFLAKEKPKAYLNLLIMVLVVNLVLNYFLIKIGLNYSEVWAISGAAIATAFSWLVYTLGLFYLSKKKLKIKTRVSNIYKPLIGSTVMVVVIYFIKSYLESSFLSLMVLVLLGVLVYSIVIFTIKGIEKEDIDYLSKVFRLKKLSFQ